MRPILRVVLHSTLNIHSVWLQTDVSVVEFTRHHARAPVANYSVSGTNICCEGTETHEADKLVKW